MFAHILGGAYLILVLFGFFLFVSKAFKKRKGGEKKNGNGSSFVRRRSIQWQDWDEIRHSLANKSDRQDLRAVYNPRTDIFERRVEDENARVRFEDGSSKHGN